MRSIFNNIIRIIKENILLIFVLVVVLLVSAYAEGNDLDFTIDNQTDGGTFNSVQDGQDNDIDFDIVSMDNFIIDIDQIGNNNTLDIDVDGRTGLTKHQSKHVSEDFVNTTEKDKCDYHSSVAAPKRKKRAGTPTVTELHAETEEKGSYRVLRAEVKQDWHLPTGRTGEKRQKKQGAAADNDDSWLERGCRRRRRGYPNVTSSSSERRSLPKLY